MLTWARLGKGGQKSPGLWIEENNVVPPPSPLPAWRLGDAFLEGNSLLQAYPIEAAGGVDRILQTALDLQRQREQQNNRTNTHGDKLSLGARLKVTMWKGFTYPVSSSDGLPTESETSSDNPDSLSDDGNHTETSPSFELPTITSRLATTVWRGLTNQSAMETPPSPVGTPAPAVSRSSSPPPVPDHENTTKNTQESSQHVSSPISLNLWSYAEKVKESDAVATISKISSNWRAKALTRSWGGANGILKEEGATPKSSHRGSFGDDSISRPRGGSLPPPNRSDAYSPPARPLYFRPPRDSIILAGNPTLSPTSASEFSASDPSSRKEDIPASLGSPTYQNSAHAIKSGPRPLLLSPTTSITSALAGHVSRSSSSTPASGGGEWAHVMRANGHNLHRGSQSSVSSSPSDAFHRSLKSGRSDCDSDPNTSSRRVPLNRKSFSPMAPSFKAHQGRPTSTSFTTSVSGSGSFTPPLSIRSTEQASLVDSRGTLISPPIISPQPRAPIKIQSQDIVGSDEQGPMIFSEMSPVDSSRKRIVRRTPSPSQYQQGDTSDSSVVVTPARSPRLRLKRYSTRPPNLNIEDHASRPRPNVDRKVPNSNSLAVEWPAEDHEMISTPRASNFDTDEPSSSSPVSSRSRRTQRSSADTQDRKSVADVQEVRMRKLSTGQRSRKSSSDRKDVGKKARDSSAEEGDDEGYDELLSAYESEEGSQIHSRR
jgi:hypothetical protein